MSILDDFRLEIESRLQKAGFKLSEQDSRAVMAMLRALFAKLAEGGMGEVEPGGNAREELEVVASIECTSPIPTNNTLARLIANAVAHDRDPFTNCKRGSDPVEGDPPAPPCGECEALAADLVKLAKSAGEAGVGDDPGATTVSLDTSPAFDSDLIAKAVEAVRGIDEDGEPTGVAVDVLRDIIKSAEDRTRRFKESAARVGERHHEVFKRLADGPGEAGQPDTSADVAVTSPAPSPFDIGGEWTHKTNKQLGTFTIRGVGDNEVFVTFAGQGSWFELDYLLKEFEPAKKEQTND